MSPDAMLEALHFLRPAWLWALAALPLLALAWYRRSARRNPWRDAVDAHLLPYLLEDAPRDRAGRFLSTLLAVLAMAAALVALAGPSWQRGPQPLWQVRTPLVIALDLSASILAADLPPTRLAQARAKLAALLDERAGGQVGMLVYAEDAYVVAPLTDDAANVALFLEALEPGIMPGDAQAPARAERAIARARDLLQQAGFDHGDILLLAGDVGDDAIAAAREARADGFPVSVLGLGTAAGAPWRDGSGAIRQARLEADALQALAEAGGGRFAALAPGRADLDSLGVLDPRPAGAHGADGGSAQVWRDQGYWLLLPLLLLVPFAFRRGGALALVAACLLFPWQPARAREAGDWWHRPDQQVHARAQAGARAYREGDFAQALQAWHGLPGADAAYNRGNALAKQGRFADAIAAYDRALQLQPGMADAIANREAVRKAMERQPPAAGQGEKKGPQDTGKQDARQQADADAAQRERMQQAMKQPQARQDAEAQAQARAPGETPHEQEQRLATEAWLRRVPDDPGGLLRARFQLEYRRRREQGR